MMMSELPDILTEILAHKAQEVEADRQARSQDELVRACRSVQPTRNLAAALRRPAGQGLRVLAEVKRKSPSAGLIRPDFDARQLASMLTAAGADAISVLTDERYFGGHLEFIAQAREASPLPVMRKDFIIDPYQLWQARAAGADGFLLIAEALPVERLRDMVELGRDLGMAALVECHAAEGLELALESGAELIGINNRDLRSFTVTLETTVRLAAHVPADRVLVSESGITSAADAAMVRRAGAHALLVGESLMRAADPAALMQQLKQAE